MGCEKESLAGSGDRSELIGYCVAALARSQLINGMPTREVPVTLSESRPVIRFLACKGRRCPTGHIDPTTLRSVTAWIAACSCCWCHLHHDATGRPLSDILIVTPEALRELYAWCQVDGWVYVGLQGNPVASAIVVDGDFPVTALGQRLRFALAAIPIQFDVAINRIDSTGHTIVARTVDGHPLAGWRYWRVFQRGPGRLVLETGAVDGAACVSWVPSFLVDRWVIGSQLRMWRHYLARVRDELSAPQATTTPNLIGGVWEYDRRYLMTQICGHPPAVSGWCQ